jgi:hypothetical protein
VDADDVRVPDHRSRTRFATKTLECLFLTHQIVMQ